MIPGFVSSPSLRLFTNFRKDLEMKFNSKVLAIGATSAALVGGLAFAAPSIADTESATSPNSSENCERGERIHAELEATITGIPSDLSKLRDVMHGAYFTGYELDSATLPETQPTEDGRFVPVRPDRSEFEMGTRPTIDGDEFIGELGLRAGSEVGTSYFALYPSDGGSPVLVTVVVDENGVATASASSELSVSYDEAAADAPQMGHKGDKGHPGGKGMRGGFRGGHGPAPEVEVTPNA